MFASKPGANPSETHYGCSTLG